MAGFGNIGGSDSTTAEKTIQNNAQITASDQATVVSQRHSGNRRTNVRQQNRTTTTGARIVAAKGATVNFTSGPSEQDIANAVDARNNAFFAQFMANQNADSTAAPAKTPGQNTAASDAVAGAAIALSEDSPIDKAVQASVADKVTKTVGASADKSVDEIETGKSSNMLKWVGIAFAALIVIAIGGMILKRRKKA